MYLVYMDEAGDDGCPGKSELFVLSSLYMDSRNWHDNYEKIREYRRWLFERYQIPVRIELHTHSLFAGKNPYKDMGLSPKQKREILFSMFETISLMDVRLVNVCINKRNISGEYPVFENALTYNLQRIENDLEKNGLSNGFMLITDQGRLAKTKKVTRKLQQINYIPSKLAPGTSYRREMVRIIEDPFEKPSQESCFIQVTDAVAYVTYLYCAIRFNQTSITGRVGEVVNDLIVEDLMETIASRLNHMASYSNNYGIVHVPKVGKKIDPE